MFFKPVSPPYDPLEWDRLPFPEKARMVCEAWALQGYGTPLAVYLFYVLKVLLYVAGWAFFCRFTPGMGHLSNVGEWWLAPEAFQKAILWSALFEGLGLGCGSGPLTGRYMPPFGGALYFLRPGTTKLPMFPGAPIIGRPTRSWLDASVYLANAGFLVAALSSAHPSPAQLAPVAVLLPVLGVLDKTVFLAFRGEHFWTTIAVFALSSDFVPGAKAIHASLWFWAGVSKLNHHFPSVVGVMVSNSPVTRFAWMRRLMYRRFPDALNPSRLAVFLAHAGTALELSVPVVLLAGDGGTVTWVGLVMMILLHGFITSNVPMGVPIEWNFMMVYGGFFLFYRNAAESIWNAPPVVLGLVAVFSVAIPVVGNVAPEKVPFLLSMRYYAGNWAYGVWFFRRGAHEKLTRLKTSSAWVYDQLGAFYDRATIIGLVGKIMAFRLMHLHGRLLPKLVHRALPEFTDYEWIDGEVLAGLALGWNFGDGHLHGPELLHSIQAQCGFEEGELRCVMVESQPLGKSTLAYRIFDAKTGLLEAGTGEVSELRRLQPWG